ncbi:MAG: UDP-N-acetylmuramate:L-alanyl-gamma-D-glutamyl-meso-diaminopimelate ligase [Calditrichaeota bacterium]|nr:MAG: UDP-N-acetylmuramate:L-alanyl-gamma-D-glutamyl-meso-diaminopimelate ligase [Calditrichota bacterium]
MVKPRRYYFLGICGTAMASLAVLLKLKGHQVWGTDAQFYPPMSDFLAAHDIPLWQGYRVSHLDKPFDVAVIGNALSRGNQEVEAILNRRLPFRSLPEVIRQEFVEQKRTIVVTGTHGKTTTTALISWIFHEAGLSPTFLIGGIARNFQSSVALGEGEFFIIEGDEYDCAFFDKRPKFLHYFPEILIANNLEFDHADIYRSLADIQDGFRKLMRIVPSRGLVVANQGSAALKEVLDPVYSRLTWFGASGEAEWHYQLLEGNGLPQRARIYFRGRPEADLTLPLPGAFQVENALAAAIVARECGIPWKVIAGAVSRFQGVQRRLEPWPGPPGAQVYEDFAHHPTAVEKTLQAVRRMHPNRKLVAVFEPRTNTMVQNILQEPLARALAVADVAVLLPIHRAEKIPPQRRLSRERIAQHLSRLNKRCLLLNSPSELLPALEPFLDDQHVVVIMTNGNLGGEYQKLKRTLTGMAMKYTGE